MNESWRGEKFIATMIIIEFVHSKHTIKIYYSYRQLQSSFSQDSSGATMFRPGTSTDQNIASVVAGI